MGGGESLVPRAARASEAAAVTKKLRGHGCGATGLGLGTRGTWRSSASRRTLIGGGGYLFHADWLGPAVSRQPQADWAERTSEERWVVGALQTGLEQCGEGDRPVGEGALLGLCQD